MLKKYKTIWISLIMNILVLVILSLISYPKYESDIDIMMQAVIYGIQGGDSSAYLVFSNIFIGGILKGMVSVLPFIPWYTVFHYCFVFMALCVISCVFLRENESVLGKIILSIFLVFSGYECYIRLGYFKTSAIVCAATIYFWIYLVEKEKKRKILFVPIVLGFWLSSMISWTGFWITAITSLTCFLLYFILKAPYKLLSKRLLFVLVLSLIGSIGIKFIDNQMYRNSNEWETALEYRNNIEKVTVFGAADYSDDVYEQLGIEEEQYNYLLNGIYLSPNQKGLELLKEISHIYKDISLENVLGFFRTVPIHLLQTGMFFCFVLLWGLSYFTVKKEKRKMFFVSISILLFAYFIFYMVNAWEKSVTGFLVFLPLCIFALMNCKDVNTRDINHIVIYLLVIMLILYNKFSYMLITSVAKDDLKVAMEWQIREEGLYAIDLNEFLKGYSAYVSYLPGLIDEKGLKLVNGNYMVFPAYQDVVTVNKRDIWNGIQWGDEWKNVEDIYIE